MRRPPRPERAYDPADPLARRFQSGGPAAPRPAFRAALRADLIARPPASPLWHRIAALPLPGPLARPAVALTVLVIATAVTAYAALLVLRAERLPEAPAPVPVATAGRAAGSAAIAPTAAPTAPATASPSADGARSLAATRVPPAAASPTSGAVAPPPATSTSPPPTAPATATTTASGGAASGRSRPAPTATPVPDRPSPTATQPEPSATRWPEVTSTPIAPGGFPTITPEPSPTPEATPGAESAAGDHATPAVAGTGRPGRD